MTFYERMKQKLKNDLSEVTYSNYFLNALCCMFDWRGLPFEQRFIEAMLHIDGFLAIQPNAYVDGGFAVSPCPALNGDLDQFGYGTRAEGVTMAGSIQVRGEIGKDVVLCWNNTARTGDFDIMQYANYLQKVDTATVANIKLSGFAPILGASNSKTIAALESYLDKLLCGDMKVIADNDVIRQLQEAAGPGVYSVDIITQERVRYLQYLSGIWSDLLKRFFGKYGLNIQNTNKMAQTTEDEVHGMDSVAWVLPLDMLNCRRKFCDDCNRIFGTSWAVDFANPWKQEFEAYERRKKVDDVETEMQADEEEALIDGGEPDEESAASET